MSRTVLFIFLIITLFSACKKTRHDSMSAIHLHKWNEALEKGIINDFFSPPVAGRMYTYPNLATYSVLTNGQGLLLKGLESFPEIKEQKQDKELISLYAFYWVGKKMVYSYNFLDEHLADFEKAMKKQSYSAEDLRKAKAEAKKIAADVFEWSKEDNYKETRSATKFVLNKNAGAWKPTAPDYLDGLEPSWSKIRTYFIDSASQFTESYKPYPYDIKNSQSNFYKELKEVKEQVDKTNEDELATSKYWDCNPLAPQHVSHLTFAEKKLTPGGHWMSITRTVSKSKNESLVDASKIYSLVALSIHDGFVACWQAKYYYDYIRPITAIQENWDAKWNTLILTPNFPEYPSGHSVISGIASTVLASHYGDDIAFTDNAEEPFGMTPRNFTSFTEACDQAAMSRFYAGIHFKKAIVDGVEMGREMGQSIIKKLELYETEK